MLCPSCHADNIDGADQCVECESDLTVLDVPEGKTSIERRLMSDHISRLIPRDPLKISPDTSVREAIERIVKTGRNCALVVDADGTIVGLFTERDVLNRVALQYDTVADHPVREFMTADPERLCPNDPVVFGLNRMMVGGYRHIPIEEEGKALGVVSVRHILGYIAEQFPDVFARKR